MKQLCFEAGDLNMTFTKQEVRQSTSTGCIPQELVSVCAKGERCDSSWTAPYKCIASRSCEALQPVDNSILVNCETRYFQHHTLDTNESEVSFNQSSSSSGFSFDVSLQSSTVPAAIFRFPACTPRSLFESPDCHCPRCRLG